MPKYTVNLIRTTISLVIILTFLVGCNFPSLTSSPSVGTSDSSAGELQQTKLTFFVHLPQSLPSGDSIYLTLLDEVTGLSFNAHRYIMQAEDALTYSITLPFTIGKVLKYRYTRQGANRVEEHLYNDRPVRYRLYDVEGPAIINDVISRWTDTELQGPTGRIMGTVVDHATGKPISNLLVAAGGEQAITLADGSFLLEGLPPGTHNLVFYAMDGSYHIFQQGAVVAAGSTTPVSIQLNPAKFVTVIFTVTMPAGTPQDAPVRLAGNLTQLGNTFADLSGGVNTLAMRMPVMGKLADGRFMLTLNLPTDTYIEYKYTLGDGLWSSELASNGDFRLRQMLVPDTLLEQNDTVESWQAPDTQPILFTVNVPADTPQGEHISIQFNPGFGWLEPLPMQQIFSTQGTPQWRFNLTGPFNKLASLHYRYCRQEQCGAADDASTLGPGAVGRVTNPSANPGTISDTVTSWAWLGGSGEPVAVPDAQVTLRPDAFVAGLAFQPNYHPSYTPLLDSVINQVVPLLGVNWLMLSPTWTFSNLNPPILEALPSQDMPLPELVAVTASAQETGLSVALFPQPNFPQDPAKWWQQAERDFPWWVSFYERYSNFAVNFADVAADSGAGTMVMGGYWLDPALPDGMLPDGSPANVPVDALVRWRELIKRVQYSYHGKIAWALSYPDGIQKPPPFLDAFDQVYILWSVPLATQPNTPFDQLKAQAAAILDQEILPFQQQVGKPVILAISYPAIDQAYTGCIAIESGCLSYNLLAQPNPDIPELGLNLQAQADAYNAVLSAINDRPWISGFVSMGYYPPALLQDKSTSVHGKPASGVLLFWSQKFLGK